MICLFFFFKFVNHHFNSVVECKVLKKELKNYVTIEYNINLKFMFKITFFQLLLKKDSHNQVYYIIYDNLNCSLLIKLKDVIKFKRNQIYQQQKRTVEF